MWKKWIGFSGDECSIPCSPELKRIRMCVGLENEEPVYFWIRKTNKADILTKERGNIM